MHEADRTSSQDIHDVLSIYNSNETTKDHKQKCKEHVENTIDERLHKQTFKYRARRLNVDWTKSP